MKIDYLKNNLKLNLISVKIVTIAYLLYYIVSYISTPEDFLFNAFYLLPVPIISSIIFLNIFSQLSDFKKMPFLLFIYGLIASSVPLINTLNTDLYHAIYIGYYVLPILGIFVILGMPFIVALLSAGLILLLALILIFTSPIELSVVFESSFLILVTFMIAGMSALIMEKTQRKNYFAIYEQEELNKKIIYEQELNKKQYQELIDQKELYELVFKNTSSGVLIIDIEANKFIDCNEQVIQMLKCDNREDVLDLQPAQLSPEFQPDGVRSSEKSDMMNALAVKNGSHVFEWMHLTKAGKEIWIEVTLTPITLNGEKVLHVVWKDIADSKEAEDRLAQQYDLVNNIINTVPIRIFWKDKDGVYAGANKLFLEDIGFDSLNTLIGKTDLDLPWTKAEAESYRDDDIEVINGSEPKINYEETLTDKNGNSVVVLTSKVPLRDMNENVIGVLGAYSDITDLRDMEDELQEQRQQMIVHSRLAQMGEMISMIAHQWRQPLGAIATTSINLKMKIELEAFDLTSKTGILECNEYFLERLNNISHYVENLTTTIDDFRNFYKQDKKSINISLAEVVLKSLNIIEASLSNDKIEIIKEFNTDEKIKLYDNEMMQVILNILKNAQDSFKEKQIENQKITIKVDKQSLSICDNGGGIPEDILDKIFDPYFSTKDEKNGTGLGLYMSKTIVEEHHKGKLFASNEDGGVCFKIELNR